MRSNMPTLSELASDYQVAKDAGAPMLACDGMLEPEGFESLRMLITGWSRPITTHNDDADINYAGGLQAAVPGVPKTHHTNSITFIETDSGIIQEFSEWLMERSGSINCWAYDGRPDRARRKYLLQDCTFTFENGGDIQSDSRSQIMTLTATMGYMYFGMNAATEPLPGDNRLVQMLQTTNANATGPGSGLRSLGQALGQGLLQRMTGGTLG